MKIEQRFTATGLWGVALLFLGPVVSGVAYWFYLDGVISAAQMSSFGVRSGFDAAPYFLFMFGGALASLAAFPMMIIGREFEGYSQRLDESRSDWL